MKICAVALLTALFAAGAVLADSETVNDRTWSYVISGGEATVTGVSPDTGVLYIPSVLGKCPVTAIAPVAFENCGELLSVTIPMSVERIGERAFFNCNGLRTVTLPYGVESVGDRAFSYCGGLLSVTLAASVTNLGSQVFASCTGLVQIAVNAWNPAYSSPDGLLCSQDGSVLIQGVNGDVTVPASVARIGDLAFSGCSGLTSVTLPKSVTNIAENAFAGCGGLESYEVAEENPTYSSLNGLLCTKVGRTLLRGVNGEVSVPTNVRQIAASAFSGCVGLTSVTFSNGVTRLDAGLFSGCSALQTVAIPKSVTEIDLGAFAGCNGLTAFTVDAANPAYRATNGMLCTKDGATVLRGVNGTVKIPTGVTCVGESAFAECRGLTSVTMAAGVTGLCTRAFYRCAALTSVKLPDGLERIGEEAFAYCSGLATVTFPEDVTFIGARAFVGTPFYENKPDGLVVLGAIAYAVKGTCPSSVVVPRTVSIVGAAAFKGCGTLESVMIPSSVTEIAAGAFDGCGELDVVYVDDEDEIVRVKGLYAWPEGVVLRVRTVWSSVLGEQVRIETDYAGYMAAGLPSGMKFDKKTGLLTGACKKVGEYSVTFTAADARAEQVAIVIREEDVELDEEAIAAAIPGVGLGGSVEIKPVAAVTGVKSVSVSGQPTGMKFTAKTGLLTGTPTKSGTFAMKVTVTTVGGTKKVLVVPVTVTPLPEMAVGTFNGVVGTRDGDGFENCGTIVFTSSEAGKLTAKVTLASGSQSLSASGWNSATDGVYAVTMATKKGVVLDIELDTNAARDVRQLVGTFVSADGAFEVEAQRKTFGTTWSLVATGDETEGWTLRHAADAKSADVKVTVKADGVTSLSGKLGGLKVSATGVANLGGVKGGALRVDFAPIVSVKSGKKTVKKALFIRTDLRFDCKEDRETVIGSAQFVD